MLGSDCDITRYSISLFTTAQSNALLSAGFLLASKKRCDPFYTANHLPPLIPLEQNPATAVRLFPFVNSANLEAQLKIASAGVTKTPPTDAKYIIEEQSLQIAALDELVRKLQAEKAVLEDELRQYRHSGNSHHNTTPSNPLTVKPTHYGSGSQGRYTAPATLHARSVGNPPISHDSVGRVPLPSRHHVSNLPSPSRRSIHSPPPPSHQGPSRFAPTPNISPLRVLGQSTANTFNDLEIPDYKHNVICDIVESVIPEKWQSSLLDLGIADADGVSDLIRAMELDTYGPER